VTNGLGRGCPISEGTPEVDTTSSRTTVGVEVCGSAEVGAESLVGGLLIVGFAV
jgi:hypothetical protein